MWAGHQGGEALPVAEGAADVSVAGHHQPQAGPAPAPPIHWGVHTALNWELQVSCSLVRERAEKELRENIEGAERELRES